MAAKKKKVATKKTPKDAALEFGARDSVRVTYQTKWYDIVDVPGIILRANRSGGWPFKVQLQDEKGKVINLGHDDNTGEPGSGPFMYCDAKNLKLVEKYVPKRLEGVIKEDWKVGDRFTPKDGFSMDQDEHDDLTGVTEEMVKSCTGQPLTVVAIINRLGPNWLLDGTENYCWLKEWIDPIE